jgi:hypothetical protein
LSAQHSRLMRRASPRMILVSYGVQEAGAKLLLTPTL